MAHANPTRGERLPRPDPSQERYPQADIIADAIDRHGLSVSIGLAEAIAEVRRLVSAIEALKPEADSGVLARIESKLDNLIQKGEQQMALGQTILDAVAAETTAVDSLITYLEGLVANNTITTEEAAKILANVNENRVKLETALVTGVAPPTV